MRREALDTWEWLSETEGEAELQDKGTTAAIRGQTPHPHLSRGHRGCCQHCTSACLCTDCLQDSSACRACFSPTAACKGSPATGLCAKEP